ASPSTGARTATRAPWPRPAAPATTPLSTSPSSAASGRPSRPRSSTW
ncbi:hypothetical protein CFC21_036798, partial [Triticum aestivum]